MTHKVFALLLCAVFLCCAQTSRADDYESILSALTAAGYVDVTSSYFDTITSDPGFENRTAITKNVTGTATNQDYADYGWTQTTDTARYGYGGAVEMGGSYVIYTNTATYGKLPTTKWDGESEGILLGIGTWMSAGVYYESESITLPAGSYALMFHNYQSVKSTSTTSLNPESYTGFVEEDGTEHYVELNFETYKVWETDTVTFTLDKATKGTIRVGAKSTATKASAMSIIYTDDVTIFQIPSSEEGDDLDENGGTSYILKVQGEYSFLTHGGSWGTEAIPGELGLPFQLVSQGDGSYLLRNADYTAAVGEGRYLYWTDTGGTYYVDGYSSNGSWTSAGNDGGWTLEKNTDGTYYLKDANDLYLCSGGSYTNSTTDYTFTYLSGVSDGTPIAWELLTLQEYEDVLSEMADKQAAEAAGNIGLSVAGVAELDSLTAEYTQTDMTSYITNADMSEEDSGWEAVGYYQTYTAEYQSLTAYSTLFKTAGVTLDLDGMYYIDKVGGLKQDIEDLPAGLYKVKANAIYSPATFISLIINMLPSLASSTVGKLLLSAYSYTTLTDTLLAEQSTAWLYASTNSQTSISKLDEYAGEEYESTDDFSLSDFLASYENEFYVYVGNGETLTLGVAMPGYTPSSTVLVTDWELTLISESSAELGQPTTDILDGSAVAAGTLTTITATYESAFTSDSTRYPISAVGIVDSTLTASIAIGDSTVAEGMLTYALSDEGYPQVTATFSDCTLEKGNTYTFTLPAGAIGWDADHTNDSTQISFIVPLIDDGAYYLKSTDGTYLGRGGYYGTQAVLTDIGSPLYLTTTTAGTTLRYLDNGPTCLLFAADANLQTIYTDNNTYPLWTLQAAEEGFVIYDGNGINAAAAIYALEDNAIVAAEDATPLSWTAESISEHNDYLTSLVDSQAVAMATAAGIADVTTKGELDAFLAAQWDSLTIDITGVSSGSESWNTYNTTCYEETVTLNKGLYRLSAQAFYRISTNVYTDSLYTLYGDLAQGATYLTLGDEQVQIVSSMQGAHTESYDGDYTGISGSNYPNSMSGAASLFEADETACLNDVFLYVEDDSTEVTLTITRGNNYVYDNWVYYDNISLTYFTGEAYSISEPDFSITDGSYVDVNEFGTVTATFTTTSIYEDAVIGVLDSTLTATLVDNDSNTIVGTITVSDDGLTLTISFEDSLSEGKTYTLTIPAGIIGYDDSHAHSNAEATITFKTKLNIEGAGYLKVAGSEYSYLSRGSSWGTRAVTDSYGAPIELAYTDGGVTIHFLDNDNYLFEADGNASTIYTDNSTYPYWTIEAVDSGYVIYDGNDTDTYGQPLCLDSDGNLAVVEDGEAIVWTIESIEDHNAYLLSLVDSQAVSTAALAGFVVADKEGLEELLSQEIFAATEIDITGKTSSSTSEFYQGSQGSATTVFTETVSGLEAGIYKVSVQAFFRIGSNDLTNTLYFDYGDLAQGAMFLTANEASQQIVSIMSEGYETAYGSNSSLPDYLASDSLYRPNCTADADSAFAEGLYNNELYTYVDEDGALTFTLIHENNYTPSSWMYYDNFEVIYYAPVLGDSLTYTTASPADGDSVEALSTITLTYDEEVTIAEGTVLYVTNATGDTVTTATITADGTTVTITLADELSEDGSVYTITVPAATIGDSTAASADFLYGNSNSEFTLTYTVPAIQVVETIVVEVELTEGTYYQGETAEFSVDAVCTALGISDISLCSQFIVNVTDGSYVENTTDGWRDANGDMATWGTGDGMVCVKIQDASSGLIDYIGTIDTSYEAGDEYDALWAFVYGYSAVIIDVHITFMEAEEISADDYTVVGSANVIITAELDEDYSYATTTGDIDEDAIAEALGCESIDDATLVAVVDGAIISTYTANYGYYFNSSGEVCNWGSDGCAFFVEWYGSGYSYLACGQYPAGMEEGDSYTVTLYFIYGENAYAITLTYTVDTDTATGISSIGQGNGTFDATTIYSLGGQLIRTQATSLEGLPQGIYIVGGKKVLVK